MIIFQKFAFRRRAKKMPRDKPVASLQTRFASLICTAAKLLRVKSFIIGGL